jgi:hypothetical protein
LDKVEKACVETPNRAVYALFQALAWLKQSKSTTGIIEYTRMLCERKNGQAPGDGRRHTCVHNDRPAGCGTRRNG